MSSLSQLHKVRNVQGPFLYDAKVEENGLCEIIFSEPITTASNWVAGWSIDDNVRFDYGFEFVSHPLPNTMRFNLLNNDVFWSNRNYTFTYNSAEGDYSDIPVTGGPPSPIVGFPDPNQSKEVVASVNSSTVSTPSLEFKGAGWDTDHVCVMNVLTESMSLTNGRSTITYSQKDDLTVVEHAAGEAAWHGARWDGTTPYADDENGDLLTTLPFMVSLQGASNVQKYSRDLTNAQWTKTSMTNSYDQVGLTGSSNTATLLTAAAGNATAVSAYWSDGAPGTWFATFWIKRITGTGNIQAAITQQGSAVSYSTLSLSSTLDVWQKVTITATCYYPFISIRIVTSGDSIVIGNVNLIKYTANGINTTEMNLWPPIFTTSGSATRNADAFSFASRITTALTFCIDVEAKVLSSSNDQHIFGDGPVTSPFGYLAFMSTGQWYLRSGDTGVLSGALSGTAKIYGSIEASVGNGVSLNILSGGTLYSYSGTTSTAAWGKQLMYAPVAFEKCRRLAVWSNANIQIAKERDFLFS